MNIAYDQVLLVCVYLISFVILSSDANSKTLQMEDVFLKGGFLP